MLTPLLYRALNGLTVESFRGPTRKFESALADPERAQRQILRDLLTRNRGCAFGKQYGFEGIRNAREFQESVPIASYDDLLPWIERIKNGEPDILTTEPVLAFEKSSGSVSASKYIPYTPSLRSQFHAALAPWITDMHRSFPRVAAGAAYWVVTPLSRQEEGTAGGIPIGFESDTEYFGCVQRWALNRTMAVPPELARTADLDDCIYLTLRFLLQARALSFISVWSPSFLLIFLERLQQHGDRLVSDLMTGRADVAARLPVRLTRLLVCDATQARNLRAMLRRGEIDPKVLWPRLALISCWTSAAAASIKTELEERFPEVPIQGKGLLATEGVVSIPIEKYGAPVAAVTSHFLEFLNEDSNQSCMVHELTEGREYAIVMTTGGGLWRYRPGDRVRVVGFAKKTPLLEFVGKEDCVSDLRGEKLNVIFVANALSKFESCRRAVFAMLSPSDAHTPYYSLFFEGRILEPDLAVQLDRRLQENPHYAYCRLVGQLGELRLFQIDRNAVSAYVDHCVALGQRAGSVKLSALHKQCGWEKVFDGAYVEAAAEVCA